MLTLGIDAGGTYTDAILLDQAGGEVRTSAKALTTYHDLSIGVGEAVSAVLAADDTPPGAVTLVSLSTTLATNAIVEGAGSPVCLLLIGYDPALMQQYGFEKELVTHDIVYIAGGHDGRGNEIAPLDEDALREAVLARRDEVDAFAVSAYFSVRNPDHEERARRIIESLGEADHPPLMVTCGHELSSQLNAVRRATTTALNARLIPLLRELIVTVRASLDALGIDAPLMIVRGDGSLVRSAWAVQRPIETILSGPAASAVGAWHLAGRKDGWVVDIGGTTTDIAFLRDGLPGLNESGAQVGRWQTMVEAVDVHTLGLGGDSLIALNADAAGFSIGPRRVTPLCLLASRYPQITADLLPDRLALAERVGQYLFAYPQPTDDLSDDVADLLEELARQPRALESLARSRQYGVIVLNRLEALEARRVVLRAGFTPTDALHVLGRFERWDTDASRRGAAVLADRLGLPVETFCERVVSGVSARAATELVSKVIFDRIGEAGSLCEPAAAALLAMVLDPTTDTRLGVDLTLRHPLIAVGASAAAYLPPAADHLHAETVIPPHADVANAVGAAVGSVVQKLRVLIQPVGSSGATRLFLPDAVRDFDSASASVAYAQTVVPDYLRERARQAGTEQVEIHMTREDQSAPLTVGWGEVYLGTELTFTAVGRPGSGRKPV